jgi:hypothetical protein
MPSAHSSGVYIVATLKIEIDELIQVLKNSDDSILKGYFDQKTGAIVLVGDGIDEITEEQLMRDPNRFLYIKPIQASLEWDIMDEFVGLVSHPKAKANLRDALDGRKPFRAFKDRLFNYPAVRQEWFGFYEQKMLRVAEQWLNENGVTSYIQVPWLSSSKSEQILANTEFAADQNADAVLRKSQ